MLNRPLLIHGDALPGTYRCIYTRGESTFTEAEENHNGKGEWDMREGWERGTEGGRGGRRGKRDKYYVLSWA